MELINKGRNGVTNFQMISVLKIAVDEKDIEKIKLLKEHYPIVFESTIKFIGRERKTILELLLGIQLIAINNSSVIEKPKINNRKLTQTDLNKLLIYHNGGLTNIMQSV